MIINRKTNNESLHKAGAITVRQIAQDQFEVDPGIDESILDAAELEAIEEQQAQEAKEAERQAKLDGIEFKGVMCSAHKEDQWGLDSVKALVRSGTSVPFYFKNGNTLTLTPANIDEFESVWVPFRMSFFQ